MLEDVKTKNDCITLVSCTITNANIYIIKNASPYLIAYYYGPKNILD